MKKLKYIITLLITFISLNSCGIYSFTGINVGDAKTFQVNYFQNNASLVEPGLDRNFTLALQERLINQTNLNLVNSNADLIYEGEITKYHISPTTATSNSTAAQNRLNMTVKVSFYNKRKEENDFEKSFSFFYDYAGSSQLIGSQKDIAFKEIFERLTQDIINASIANW